MAEKHPEPGLAPAAAGQRHTLREQAAGAIKVILLTGGLLGGLWVLQMIAKN